MVNPVSQAGGAVEILSPEAEKSSGSAGQSVSETFGQIYDQTAKNLEKADQAALQANTGGPVDLHDVMISMEKADTSLRLLVQVRNKAVDAYKEIMRMQV
ncbi:MAG: flagellar hook-basal body complex protein FliE [Thermodesulfobacteriota bacterium]